MIAFYKPNSSNSGCAFSFNIGKSGKNDGLSVYINAIKQSSWNEKTKVGSFSENAKDPEKSISVKLNEFELGSFLHAIRNYTTFKAFHSFDDNKTVINFGPYTKKDGTQAFSFSVTKNSTLKFGIGLEMGEAYALAEYFKLALNKIFTARLQD